MRLLTASILVLLTACQPRADAPAPETADTPAVQAPPAEPGPTPASAPVEGWETGSPAYAGIGATTPDFSARRADGEMISQDSLRGRWTILGFDSEATVTTDETKYLTALNSAVNQDPDLDFLQIYRLSETATRAPVMHWPAIIDVGPVSDAFGIGETPAYLLVGPDLTVEAWRGALSATPDDGIKPVIRGVADIRKQVAAPE